MKKIRKFKKSGKGIIFRPCYLCGESVNFIRWSEESKLRNKNIWHWANEDGSHHVHYSQQINHIRDMK